MDVTKLLTEVIDSVREIVDLTLAGLKMTTRLIDIQVELMYARLKLCILHTDNQFIDGSSLPCSIQQQSAHIHVRGYCYN